MMFGKFRQVGILSVLFGLFCGSGAQAADAAKGKALLEGSVKNCKMCHSETVKMGNFGGPMTDVRAWPAEYFLPPIAESKFAKALERMPIGNPLSAEERADVMAYVISERNQAAAMGQTQSARTSGRQMKTLPVSPAALGQEPTRSSEANP